MPGWSLRGLCRGALVGGCLLALLDGGCGSAPPKEGNVGGRGGAAGGLAGGGGSGAPDGGGPSDAGPGDGPGADVPCLPSAALSGDINPAWSFALGQGSVGGMKVDAHGNLIVMGSTYVSTLTVGRQTLPISPDGSNRAFVLSLDPDANVLWMRLFPGLWGPQAFALDGEGNIYLLGGQYVMAPADLGNGPITGPGVLAKLDAQGNTIWSHGLQDFLGPTINELERGALAVDPTTGQIAIAGLVYSSTGSYQPSFVAFYDASGTYLSSLTPNSATTPMSMAVAFDGSGGLAVAGTFQPTPTDAMPYPGPIQNAYVEKLDVNHAVRWNLALGEDTTVSDLVVTGTRTFVSGTFGGSLSLGGTTITSQGLADVYIATIDDGGTSPVTSLLARYPGGGSSVTGLIPDGQGGLWASGAIGTFVDFGTGMLAPPADVVWHVDETGHTVASGAFSGGGGGASFQQPIAADAAGNLYSFGSFFHQIDLGTGVLVDPSTEYYSLFLAKYVAAAPTVRGRSCPPPAGALLAAPSPRPGQMKLAGQTIAFATGTETFTVPLAGGAPSLLAAAQKHIAWLAVAGSTVYWANSGSVSFEGPPSNGSIVSVPLAGGTPTVLADGQDGPVAIAVDDTNVYWATSGMQPGGSTASTGAAVWALPLGGGGTPRSLATGLGASGPIAAAGGVVVFAAGSTIMKVPRDGGAASAIATTDRRVTDIALDESSVYWLDADSQGTDLSDNRDGRLRQATLDGATSTILASGLPGPGGFSLVAGTLIWCNSGAVWSIPAAGGTPAALASGFAGVGPCAADGQHVAWVESDSNGNWKLVSQPR